MLQIQKITNPEDAQNAYVIWQEGEHSAIVIDPSLQIKNILYFLQEEALTCTAILLTHGHFDHIAGVEELRKQSGAPVYIHKNDAPMLIDSTKNGSAIMSKKPLLLQPAEQLFLGDQQLLLCGLQVFAMHTPGHTVGSMCYRIENALFSGDTLFYLSIGRTDLPSGSEQDMHASLLRFRELEEDYEVYPGHAQSTQLSFEIANNPFLGEEGWRL